MCKLSDEEIAEAVGQLEEVDHEALLGLCREVARRQRELILIVAKTELGRWGNDDGAGL